MQVCILEKQVLTVHVEKAVLEVQVADCADETHPSSRIQEACDTTEGADAGQCVVLPRPKLSIVVMWTTEV